MNFVRARNVAANAAVPHVANTTESLHAELRDSVTPFNTPASSGEFPVAYESALSPLAKMKIRE